jgi:hypothetical protein
MEHYDIDHYNEMERRTRLNGLFAAALHTLLDIRHELDASNARERAAKTKLADIDTLLMAMQRDLCRP